MKAIYPGFLLAALSFAACGLPPQYNNEPGGTTETTPADQPLPPSVPTGSVDAVLAGAVQGAPFIPQVALFTPFTNAAGRAELLLLLSDQKDLCSDLGQHRLRGGGRALQLELYAQQDANTFLPPNAQAYSVFGATTAKPTPTAPGAYAVGQFAAQDGNCQPTLLTAQQGKVNVNALSAEHGLTGSVTVQLDNPNDMVLSRGTFAADACPALVNLGQSKCVAAANPNSAAENTDKAMALPEAQTSGLAPFPSNP